MLQSAKLRAPTEREVRLTFTYSSLSCEWPEKEGSENVICDAGTLPGMLMVSGTFNTTRNMTEYNKRNESKYRKLTDGDETITDPKDMCELLNEKFHLVFTKETQFNESKYKTSVKQMQETTVSKEEIYKMIEELDVRKATGSDGIPGFLLKESRKQLTEPLYDNING